MFETLSIEHDLISSSISFQNYGSVSLHMTSDETCNAQFLQSLLNDKTQRARYFHPVKISIDYRSRLTRHMFAQSCNTTESVYIKKQEHCRLPNKLYEHPNFKSPEEQCSPVHDGCWIVNASDPDMICSDGDHELIRAFYRSICFCRLRYWWRIIWNKLLTYVWLREDRTCRPPKCWGSSP